VSFENFIHAVETRNPGLFSETRQHVQIRPKTLKSLLLQAYQAGREETKAASGDSLFERIFGR
jgi:hypothetical protein